jgi:RNA-binding protein Luc7-like 2
MFKQEHENHIYGFVDDCDRRIKMAQRKLEKTPEENRKTVDLVSRVDTSFDVEDGGTSTTSGL